MVVEPNAMPGFTNRVLARFVDAAALTFEDALKYFGERGRVTGNPVRNDFALLKKKERGERLSILIFGGSQGAHAINTAMVEALRLLAPERRAPRHHAPDGRARFRDGETRLHGGGIRRSRREAVHSKTWQRGLKRRTCSICRSGATTAAEVAAAGKAAIFVPFPFATDDHQRKNAEAFVRAGAGRMILQKELTPERLAGEIKRLIDEPGEIDRMEEASRQARAAPDSAERAVDLAMEDRLGETR